MTYEEAVKKYEKYGKIDDWVRLPGETLYWSGIVGMTGPVFFSFDGGKNVFPVFGVGKNELTPEQTEILQRENHHMAYFYLTLKKYTPQDVMDEATSMGYADATYYGEKDGTMYYKLVPKEDSIINDAMLFLSQDKAGKIETVNKMVMRSLFPMRYDLR